VTPPKAPATTTPAAKVETPAKKAVVDKTPYLKRAKEEAKKEWTNLKKKSDNNNDNRVTFQETLLAYAKANGCYIDEIPKTKKAQLKEEFGKIDINNNGYVTEQDFIDQYTIKYEKMAEQGIALK
jgi:Ca2+-binding EF-hand superfamily protein